MAVTAAALVPGAPEAAAGSVLQQGVHGKLAPSDPESDADGQFRLRVKTRGNGMAADSVEVGAKRLDATKAEDGSLPDYHVWLVNSDASASADFGSMRLRENGHAALRWNSRKDEMPSGASSLLDFGGGKVEVRLGDTVVLAGDVPAFVDLGDDNGQGSGARTVSRVATRLRGADGVRAQGYVEARYANLPRGAQERLRVAAVLLDRRSGPYTVVCIDGSAVETEIGTLEPHGRFGQARVVFDTKDGDTIPGGGVTALAGQTVEVRDPNGAVVLSGTFPSIQQ